MLTLGENLGFYCADIASNYFIRDFMPALDLTSKLIELVDPELFEMVESMGGQPTFTLSWFLTWFSHDIENFSKV